MTLRAATVMTLLALSSACEGQADPDSDEVVAEKRRPPRVKGEDCRVDNGGCDDNARCTQVKKKVVQCSCNPGFSGDGLTCTAAGVRISGFDVTMTGATSCESGFGGVVRWTSVAEPALVRYLVQTSTEGAPFVDRDSQSPRGAGAAYEARFGLFDSGGKQVVFRVVAVLSDGSREVLATSIVLAVPPNPC